MGESVFEAGRSASESGSDVRRQVESMLSIVPLQPIAPRSHGPRVRPALKHIRTI